jgi:hypothetical protein
MPVVMLTFKDGHLSCDNLELLQDDIANGKDTNWWELEISGTVKNISPSVWKLTHLTALYLVRNPTSLNRKRSCDFKK